MGEQEIKAMIAEREKLRAEKRFAEADAIRDQLAAAGVKLEDRIGGTVIDRASAIDYQNQNLIDEVWFHELWETGRIAEATRSNGPVPGRKRPA